MHETSASRDRRSRRRAARRGGERPGQLQGPLQGQYPNKPITLVVPFGPGSTTDTISRIIAQYLGNALNQSIVIENKPGANGAIAAAYVARAAPDGYTLLMSTNSPHSAAPSLNKSIAYDPVKDFEPVSRIGSFTLMLVLHPDVPATSIPELIAYAKAHPGKLSFASGNASGRGGRRNAQGLGRHQPRACALSKHAAGGQRCARRPGIDDVHRSDQRPAPCQSPRAARPGGHQDAAQHVVSRASLPARGRRRQTSTWIPGWAAFAPAHTPPEIVTRLNTELRKIVDNPEIKARIGTLGFEAFSSTPAELGSFVKVQLDKWTRMIKDAGIEPE